MVGAILTLQVLTLVRVHEVLHAQTLPRPRSHLIFNITSEELPARRRGGGELDESSDSEDGRSVDFVDQQDCGSGCFSANLKHFRRGAQEVFKLVITCAGSGEEKKKQ